MKRLFLIAAVCAAAPSFASFELVLVLDKGNGKVHRFDGTTGAYFGSFGNFSNQARSLSIDRTTNSAYVFDPISPSNFLQFNYNTGELMNHTSNWSTNIPHFSVVPGQNRVLITLNTSVFNRTLPQGGETAFNTGLAVSRARQVGSNVVSVHSDRIRLFNSTGTQLSEAVGGSGNINGDAFQYTNPFGGTSTGFVTANGTTGGRLSAVNPNSLSGSVPWATASLTGTNAVAPGHVGFYALGKNSSNAAQGRVVRMSVSSTLGIAQLNNFGENVLVDPVDIATVVAPEPGTMAALGIGALALMRRRRRAK